MTSYSEIRAQQRAETARVLEAMHPTERAFHAEIGALRGWARPELIPADELTRKVLVTPFPGAYGTAGYVVTLEGSPPRFLAVVQGKGEGCPWSAPLLHVLEPRRPRIRPIDWRPNTKWGQLRRVVLEYVAWHLERTTPAGIALPWWIGAEGGSGRWN